MIRAASLVRTSLSACIAASCAVAQLQFPEEKDHYSIQDARRDYRFTTGSARKTVLEYCRSGDTAEKPDVLIPVFERAMAGDMNALKAVFSDAKFHSGDNESWAFTGWPLMNAVGDKRFAAYLKTLDARARADVFEQVFYLGSYYALAIRDGYFARKFRRVARIFAATLRETPTRDLEIIKNRPFP